MEVLNAGDFDRATRPGRCAYLAARGFKVDYATGAVGDNRSGGIAHPVAVDLPAGAVLFRFFHLRERALGEWWLTPSEARQIVDHFGRSGPALAIGRKEGQGILHRTLAVRHEWSRRFEGDEPKRRHLGRMVAKRLRRPMRAYHGEGDSAPSADLTSNQKVLRIIDGLGRHRAVRQIFLPRAWEHADALEHLGPEYYVTDSELEPALRRHRQAALAFET